MNFINKLDKCSEFSCIFELVKKAVEDTLGKRRAGLSLGLSNLPDYIGAVHQVGSNFIIMNKKLLDDVIETKDRKIINSYIFHVLLHEYIHSLGFLNEQETQALSYLISKKTLGSNHLATLIARYGIGYILSGIHRPRQYEPEDMVIEIIKDFERDLNYFG